jgi:hypothetical protein
MSPTKGIWSLLNFGIVPKLIFFVGVLLFATIHSPPIVRLPEIYAPQEVKPYEKGRELDLEDLQRKLTLGKHWAYATIGVVIGFWLKI